MPLTEKDLDRWFSEHDCPELRELMRRGIQPFNGPFERLPRCSCDPGFGDPPTKLKMMKCKMRGGPCSESYWKDPEHPERNQPNESKS